MSKWTIKDGYFCESLIYGAPEYVNSFTSLFILFIGLYLLYNNAKMNDIIIRFISGSIAVTGIGSFIYHWTLWKSTGLLDTIPMLLAAYSSSYLCFDIILYKYIKMGKKNDKLYELLVNIICLIILCFLYISIMITAIDSSNNIYFVILFLLPNIIIIFAALFMRFYTFYEYYNDDNGNIELCNNIKHSFYSIILGLSCILFFALLWFVTELNCKKEKYNWIKYLYTHGFWHIGMSFGYYHLMIFFIFMNSLIKGKNPIYRYKPSGFYRYLYIILPIIDYYIDNNNILIYHY